MSEQRKPSAAAVRIAQSVTELLHGYSVTNYLPPIDTVIAADADIRPLIEALGALLALAEINEVPAKVTQERFTALHDYAKGDA